jgi:hypothetical protein
MKVFKNDGDSQEKSRPAFELGMHDMHTNYLKRK